MLFLLATSQYIEFTGNWIMAAGASKRRTKDFGRRGKTETKENGTNVEGGTKLFIVNRACSNVIVVHFYSF